MECRTELYLLQKLVVKQDFVREGKNTRQNILWRSISYEKKYLALNVFTCLLLSGNDLLRMF